MLLQAAMMLGFKATIMDLGRNMAHMQIMENVKLQLNIFGILVRSVWLVNTSKPLKIFNH